MRTDALIALLQTIPPDAEVKIWAAPENYPEGHLTLRRYDGDDCYMLEEPAQ